VRKHRILGRNFTIEDGELTATMKVRRTRATEDFPESIDELYAGLEQGFPYCSTPDQHQPANHCYSNLPGVGPRCMNKLLEGLPSHRHPEEPQRRDVALAVGCRSGNIDARARLSQLPATSAKPPPKMPSTGWRWPHAE
jgi:hypothetical protein